MRVFSGIQPTGEIHIGNYTGAIRQWISLQQNNECIFCIVDLHSLTVPYKPDELKKRILEKVIVYIAAGVDPEKSIIFVQSEIKEHSELAWLLSTLTPLGDVNRMTQFKEKAKKYPKNVNLGLLNYPVLMASDILLYKTDIVPVGIDQKQHIELTREIARKFNKKFGQTFKVPRILLPERGKKIYSLQNPKRKMSKTDKPQTYISLFDSPEDIKEKIMASVTDLGRKILYSSTKPGISNLLTIYSIFKEEPIKKIEKQFKGKGYELFKKSLVNLLIEKLEPFRRKKKELLKREVYIEEILNKGAKRAQVVASSTIKEVKKKMGLI